MEYQEFLEQEFFRFLALDSYERLPYAREALDQLTISAFTTPEGRDAYLISRWLLDRGRTVSAADFNQAQFELCRPDHAIMTLTEWLLGGPKEWLFGQLERPQVVSLANALKTRQAQRERQNIYARAAAASSSGDFAEADRLANEAAQHKIAGVVASNIGGAELINAARISSDEGIATGYFDLDACLFSGLGAGELAIVGARPSAGKSSLAIGLQQRWADLGICSLYVSCEDSAALAGTRLASLLTGANLLARSSDHDAKIDRALRESSKLQDHIRFVPAMGKSIDEICDSIRAACVGAEHKSPRVVMVDYLQAIPSFGKPDHRRHELKEFTRRLKVLGDQKGIPVILFSQLSRIEGEPTMQNLRDSGELEEMAEYVCLLWRTESESWLRLAKAKRGIAGKKFEILWNPDSRMIDDVRLAANQSTVEPPRIAERRHGGGRRSTDFD